MHGLVSSVMKIAVFEKIDERVSDGFAIFDDKLDGFEGVEFLEGVNKQVILSKKDELIQ